MGMRTGGRTAILPRLALCGLLLGLPGLQAAPAEGRWEAGLDPQAAPGDGASRAAAYGFTQEGARVTITLEYRGRVIAADFPDGGGDFVLPLGGQVRLQDPWVTGERLEARKALGNLGWNLWGSRPAAVHAAASGVVRSAGSDPAFGPTVEIDHGSGFRTRYFLSLHGAGSVAPGTRVAAGEVIGELGAGLPDDIPSVHFALLLDTGQGDLLALDPAPFFLASAAHRASPFAASLLNAAVRAQDPARVSRLIGLGVDPNLKAADCTRALEWAVMARDAGMARLLVAAGADPAARTAEYPAYDLEEGGRSIAHDGPTLLEYAGESGDPELLAAVGGN